jgi:hypothetical protein
MAETEVESILREIRERVLSQQRASQDAAGKSARLAMTNGGNGAGDSAIGDVQNRGTLAAESLALIDSYLTTTARTWDRLPPVVSNRSGVSARLELWLKRQLKAAARWFTWEQVNFNAAVHHALRDLLQVLSAHEQELRQLRAEAEARRVEAEQYPQRAEMNARLGELVSELRERDGHLRDEQQVCFKQVALETSEAAVLADRARRQTDTLLEELKRRVEKLEKE